MFFFSSLSDFLSLKKVLFFHSEGFERVKSQLLECNGYNPFSVHSIIFCFFFVLGLFTTNLITGFVFLNPIALEIQKNNNNLFTYSDS